MIAPVKAEPSQFTSSGYLWFMITIMVLYAIVASGKRIFYAHWCKNSMVCRISKCMIKIIQIEFHLRRLSYSTYMQWAHYFAFMLLLYYYCKAITYVPSAPTTWHWPSRYLMYFLVDKITNHIWLSWFVPRSTKDCQPAIFFYDLRL